MNYEERKAWMQEVNACNPTTDLIFSEWTQEREAYRSYNLKLESRLEDLESALREALSLCSSGFSGMRYHDLLNILKSCREESR